MLAKIEHAMQQANAPQRKRTNRRRGEEQPAPDITFRWRQRANGPRSRDRLP
jgi:hypothetical protein